MPDGKWVKVYSPGSAYHNSHGWTVLTYTDDFTEDWPVTFKHTFVAFGLSPADRNCAVVDFLTSELEVVA